MRAAAQLATVGAIARRSCREGALAAWHGSTACCAAFPASCVQALLEAPLEGFTSDGGSLLPAMLAPDQGALSDRAGAALAAALKGAKLHARALARLAAMVDDNRWAEPGARAT